MEERTGNQASVVEQADRGAGGQRTGDASFFAHNLADELFVQDITEPSSVLGPLSDHELQAAYDFVLERFALELLIGAHENSDWSNGKLVIDANHGPIHLLQAAFYAVKLVCQRRDGVVCC